MRNGSRLHLLPLLGLPWETHQLIGLVDLTFCHLQLCDCVFPRYVLAWKPRTSRFGIVLMRPLLPKQPDLISLAGTGTTRGPERRSPLPQGPFRTLRLVEYEGVFEEVQ